MRKLLRAAARRFGLTHGVRQDNGLACLNEAVNFELQSIFIAIPKTGTTSVRTQIRPAGTPLIRSPHLSILQVRDAIYVYLLNQALGRNARFPTGQVPRDAELRAQSAETFARFFKFASVRNPWARAASMYFRREGVKAARQMSFEAFCEHHIYASDTCVHPTLHVNQMDWLVDERDHVIMDYVYRIEDLRDAIDEIRERTHGRIQLSFQRLNTNPQSFSTRYRELYTDRSRQLIARHFEKDIDYFKYTY